MKKKLLIVLVRRHQSSIYWFYVRETGGVDFGAQDAMKLLEMLEYLARWGMRRYDNEM